MNKIKYSKGLEYSWWIGDNDRKFFSIVGIGKCKDTDIVIPKYHNGRLIEEIDDGAFRDCTSLTSITIPSSVTSIGSFAFEGCSSLTSITIPDSMTSIDDGAFRDCTSLTSVTIGSGVTEIGVGAFNECNNLKNIIVNPQNKNYKSVDGNLYSYDGKTLIQYAIGKTVTSFNIPDGVTSIGSSAFESCENLKEIVIPNSVTKIGDEAFIDCTGLEKIIIGDNVKSIGHGAFFGCDKLFILSVANIDQLNVQELPEGCLVFDRSKNVEDKSKDKINVVPFIDDKEKMADYNILSKEQFLKSYSYLTEEEYDATTRALQKLIANKKIYSEGLHYKLSDNGQNYFVFGIGDCKDTDIRIPPEYNGKPVTHICYAAFKNNNEIKSVTIPDSVTTIDRQAFDGCKNLKSVYIPDSVTNIYDNAFCGCLSLEELRLSNNINSLNALTFGFCKSLKSVIV